MSNMVQYGVWPNCCNACDFCLREERIPYPKDKQLYWLNQIIKNLDYVDFENKFSNGISLLGGELYYITDEDLQEKFLELIDAIIEKVLKKSPNPNCKYSTVTNGLYDPTFLYKVIDKIKKAVGMEKVDLNFSYDLKYRFHSEDKRLLCLKNINAFHERYDYAVGVQMILTQYVINLWKDNKFDVNEFIETQIPGNKLAFLYPHPIKTGMILDDFNFKRADLFDFLKYLKKANIEVYYSFLQSTKNSCSFKYTGLKSRDPDDEEDECYEQPVLTDGKQILTNCGHSILYRCYSDCNKCLLCDLEALDNEIYI